MNIFILDKNLKIIDKFSSEGDIQNVSPFFNDIYKQYLETGAETFKFTCTKNNNIEYGNYIAFMFDNKYKLFQISDIDETHEQNFEVEIYCEFAGIELTNEPLRARTIPSANIKQYLDTVLADVDWEVGYVDEDIADIYTIDIKKATKIYIHIQETIKKYDCEIEFRVEFKGNRVVGKYIDAYKRRGIETNVRIEYGKVADKVSRRTTGKPLSTALIGYGKDNIDFKNVEWSKSKGDPCDKPLGQDWIGDETAYKKYNRNGNHIIGIFDADTESPMELLRLTYRELQNVKEPQVDYGCNVAILDYSKIRLGDTVYVIDNEFGSDVLHLSARVNELEISFTDETKNKIEFSNYKKVKSKITPEMRNILNQIPSNTEFMGISKGGLLSSDIEADGFNIKIKNRLVNKDGKEYYVRLKDKAYTGFMNDILPHDPRYITQSFAMDFEEGCIYTSQVVTETNPEHILISKIRMSDKKVLGYMRLHGFGHGSQIGIDKLDGVTKIWCECYGEPHITTGKLFGTKICRFTFENGKEYTTSAGNVFDMVTDARNIQVSVSEQTNRLSVKYITYSNKNAIKVYDLKSVIDNDPRMLASFTIPSWLETSISPNQGHSVYGNRVYHYQGGDSAVNESKARVTIFDLMGNVLDSNIILDDINLDVKEPEGLFVRENNGIYELYAGLSEGAWPNRKYHIYKFMDSLDDDFEKRGSFIHNNGYKSNIEEVIINTCFNGSDRRKAYLLFTDKVSNKFVVASFKSGKWWIGTEEYTPRINDAIVAELAETNDRVDVSLLTNDFESIKGADGQNGLPGADAKYVLLTGEQIFKYTNNFTGTPTPSSITLTGTPFNISSSNAKWYYKKSSDTNYTLISANNGKMEFTLNHNDSTLFANNNKVVTIKFDIDGYYDEMTIAKISDGSSGSDGEDGYFVLLTNENHTVPCENDGTVVNGELEKAKTEIHVFKGTQEVSFSLSKTDVGCTSTYDSSTKTLSITSLTSKAATVTMQITVNGTVFTKVMTISKATKGDTGEDSYTVDMTNDNYSFNCDAKGNIASVITTTTVITAFKGVNPVVPTIGTLPTVAGLTLSKSNGIITIKANTGTSLADNGSFDIPVTVGGNNFIKTFSWTKVKNGSNGSNGVSVTSTDVEYAQNTSSTTAPTSGWTTTAPTWQNGKYIWSRTKTVLSDGTTKYTNPACITGQKGQDGTNGVGVSSIVEYYKVHTSNTGITNETSGFTTTIPTMTSANKYLWNYELITYTNGTTEKTSARVIGMYSKDGINGTNGSDGKGITSITNYYLASSSGSGVTTSTSGWTTTIQNVSTSKKYLWNYEVINYTTGSPTTTSPVIIGVYGDTGATGTGITSITEEYYLSTSKTTQIGGSWSTTVPTWQQGKYIWTRSVITYTDNTTTTTNGICVSGSKGDKGDKGDAGTNGTNGVNGISPVLVTITGQQSMKYLDKTTAPTPSTITLTANVMEGNVVVSSGMTYIWQYKNSSGTWVNLSGTYTSKTYSLAHNNTGFVNEVAQIRVAVSYKSKTYYLEHTVTKIYDNKYISKQEVFDKITEGGTNQLIYKDPSTGEIYINATFIKSGQLVADLIKGGILTLGGTGNSDTGDYGRFRILDSTGQNELASMDGGEMRMVNLQAEELNATNLNVKNINCATYAPAIYEYTKVYVNTTSGNDEVEFESGAVFKTLQGALDSAPKNLNGFTTEIVLQTAVSENIVIRGFSGGTLNILMNSKNINGYVVARDCSAQVFILGGLTTTDIPDGINNTGLRPNIQPSQLFSFGGYNYSFVAIGCPFVYVRSVDIFGKTGTTTNYCGGSVNGSNVYVQNVNAYASNSGWNVTTGGKMTTKETYGRCERLAYNVQLGGVAHICNGNSTGAPSNIYTGNGGQVIQGNVTFVGSGDVGSNNNTTTNNTSIVLNANYGDSYKVKYSSWRNENTVTQGDWSGTGMHKGCWFFGNQFSDLKGKTIKSIKLTLQRQRGGNSGSVTFTLKMHNYTSKPSGSPSYLSSWSKNVSLSVGQSTTITITDSTVLTAIKNGTMKGFGIEVSSTSNSYYGILTPKLKAVVTY